MPLNDTPYDTILSLMGGGPGALANGGVGIGPATGGMAATAFGNNQQNAALSQQAADIQNQTAQHQLEQARLTDPRVAAEEAQKTQAAQIATGSQGQAGAGAALAALQAKEAEARASMSKSERESKETQDKAIADAYNVTKAPGYDSNNPAHMKVALEELDKGNVKYPSNITPEQLTAKLAMGNQVALNNIATTNALRLQAAHQEGVTTGALAVQAPKLATEKELANIHGEWTVKYGEALAGRSPSGYVTQLVKKAAAQGGLDNLNPTELDALASELKVSHATSVKDNLEATIAEASLAKNQQEINKAKDDPKKVLDLQKERIDLQRDYDKFFGPQYLAVQDARRKQAGGPVPEPGTQPQSTNPANTNSQPDPTPNAKPPPGAPSNAVRAQGIDPKTGQMTWGWKY